jgi:hypothetical protein
LVVGNQNVRIGELLAGLLGDVEGMRYVRGYLLERNTNLNTATLLDVDTQTKIELPATKLYWMVKDYYDIPTLVRVIYSYI